MTESLNPCALIVEDSEDIAELIAFVLEQEGYASEVIGDGKEGFRMATTRKYDLLVVDIFLPNWNGVEILNSLAMVQEPVPIIVCTGGNADEIAAQIQNRNVVEVMQKPFEVPVFKEALKRAEGTKAA